MQHEAVSRHQWRQYVHTRAPELREALIREHAVLARRVVDRLRIAPWGCVSRDDLLGHAVVGLIDAVDRYDPEQGPPFEWFAMPRIRGAVLDALRQLDWMPRSLRTAESRLRGEYARLESLLGRHPTDEELAAELGVSRAELDRLLAETSRGTLLSLDELVLRLGETTTRGDGLVNRSAPDPYLARQRGEARERLGQAVAALPQREQTLVSLYYYQELTLKEIGRVLGITEQRVSQLHTRAMLRLSHRLIRHTELVAEMAA